MPSLDHLRSLRQVKETRKTFYLCLSCLVELLASARDLERFLGSHFRDWTRGTDLIESLTSRLPTFSSHHLEEAHQAIACYPREIQGPITDPGIMTLLRQINPELIKSKKHFDDRAPLHPEVPSELNRIGRNDLNDDTTNVRTYKLLQGKRLKQAGSVEMRESLAALHLRVAVRRYEPDIKNGHQAVVRIESGLQVFLSLIEANAPSMLEGFHLDNRMDRLNPIQVSGQLEWHLFERYLAFTGQESLLGRIISRWPNEIPRLEDAFWELDLHPNTVRLMKGDLAILMYWVDRRSNLRQGRITRTHLFEDLRFLGYPRLQTSDDRDQRQALNRILKEIASGAEMVTIYQVNWNPVFQLIEQERSAQSKN